MKQQKKKKLFSLMALFGVLFFTTVYMLKSEKIEISEVAEQNSVIDEQAMMLPMAGVSLAQIPGESLAFSNNEKTKVKAKEDEVTIEEEVYSDGWTNASVNVRKEPSIDSEILEVYKYNTFVSKTYENDEWLKIKYNDSFAYIKTEYISDVKNESLSPYEDLINNLTDEEKYWIYQITFLEAGNQSMEGQRAVIEVILNRVLSDKYPNNVIDVLSQSGQFTTWGFREAKPHNEEQIEALTLVKEEKPILTTDYMMFSRGKFSWGRNYIKIEDHWFGTF